ncbi:MAG TPA: AlkA N-terminal domain-containing protein [Acidobacteriaceae bacterium]|nr:AlkA N-terminal domain-containing protein [Acidobacteriaceae bacterium]
MPVPSKAAAYRALESHDSRFDGLLFVAVKSTGIYCRPVCPARTPKLANCEFYSSAAAAQDAGYRPCLRCRPETAPQLAAWKGTSNTISRAMMLISEGALDAEESTVDGLAGRVGIGERQLRRLFLQHLGTSPLSVAQTRRVLFAKQLIHDTRLPMTEVALASGFNSLRRFNEVFQNLFHRPPTALRREAGKEHSAAEDEIALQLSYQAPYDWDSMLAFFAARAIPGIEIVENNAYHRAIELDGFIGTIRVDHLPRKHAISAMIRFPAVRLLPRIVTRIRRMFDLEANIRVINQHLSRDSRLGGLLAARPGLRVPGGWDSFEVALRTVLGQQVSLAVARQLAGRLTASHGKQLPDGSKTHQALTCAFPTANDIATALSIDLGMPASRLRTLRVLAQAAASDPSLLAPSSALEDSLDRLMTMPGVGDWTAQYIALRAMRDTNAFPAGDLGLLRGANNVFGHAVTPRELQKLSEAWAPWRAYAAQHLWAADGASVPLQSRKDKHDALSQIR